MIRIRTRAQQAYRDKEILRYWEQGLTDVEISRKIGVSSQVVFGARRRMGLPSNWYGEIREREPGERMRMYQCGYTDREIARLEGVRPSSVKGWRRRRGLAANKPHVTDKPRQLDPKRYALWVQGLNDRQIAKELGMSAGGVAGWRRRNGLAANDPRGRRRKEETEVEVD